MVKEKKEKMVERVGSPQWRKPTKEPFENF
jgi:hypothetical protein